MSGPFVQLPTLSEFLERAEAEFDCDRGEESVEGPRGPAKVRYLIRTVGDSTKYAVLPEIAEGERLTPSKLRSVCAALEIDHTEFCLPEDYPDIR